MDDATLLRYSRQIMLPRFGYEGQQRLLDARVLLLGLGGLGSPVALYLTAAGVGALTLVDPDRVDSTNLQRQILHGEADVGRSKSASAVASLRRLNTATRLREIAGRVEAPALETLVAEHDLVIDATDNFAARFAINAAAVAAGRPLVSGAAIRFEGQVALFPGTRGGPCYRCLYPEQGELEESCADNGVIGPLLGVVGSLQALEAVKLLAGIGEGLTGALLLIDGLQMSWRRIALRPDPACPVCAR